MRDLVDRAFAGSSSKLVLQALIQGPNSADESEGFSTEIPQDLSVISNQALEQKWAYQYSQPLTNGELAEIVCTVEADLPAPSVGTLLKGNGLLWHDCSDFIEEYGAPAALSTRGGQPSGIVGSDVPSP